MSKPDFILVGAMKCGTSTLAAQLGQQAGVFMTDPKEPNFFSDDAVYAQGTDWYGALFEGAAAGDLKGEASTHYTKLPTYPQTLTRMQRMLGKGDVKLIYMIRNPMARAVSHYIHEWTEGRLGRDADAAFQTCPEIVEYGRFAMQITPFIEAYGKEAVFLTSLEQIKSDPDGEFARVADFLGLQNATWVHDMPAQNVSAERMRSNALVDWTIQNPVLRSLRHKLVPKGLRTRIRQKFTMQDRPDIPEALQARMRATFAQDRADLAKLFPDHPALDLSYPFLMERAA